MDPKRIKTSQNSRSSKQLRQEDVPMKDAWSDDEETPLQVLVDAVGRTVMEHGDKSDMQTEFMVATYDLIHSRIEGDTFMETMKTLFKPYPELLKPLNNFMPGYMNSFETAKDHNKQTITYLTWKDFAPKKKQPIEQNQQHHLRDLLFMAEVIDGQDFNYELRVALSDLISSRIDMDTFMASMKSTIEDKKSPLLGVLNDMIPGYLCRFMIKYRNEDGSFARAPWGYDWIK